MGTFVFEDRVGRPAWNKGTYKVGQEGLAEDEKRCSGCELVYPLEFFYRAKSCYKERHNLCKMCWNEKYKTKERAASHKEASLRYWRKHHEFDSYIEIVKDPTDFWYRHSIFRDWDFVESLDVWPEGLIVKRMKDGVIMMVQDGQLIEGGTYGDGKGC